jgi:hypothetical protein
MQTYAGKEWSQMQLQYPRKKKKKGFTFFKTTLNEVLY